MKTFLYCLKESETEKSQHSKSYHEYFKKGEKDRLQRIGYLFTPLLRKGEDLTKYLDQGKETYTCLIDI
jgi:hypothetical protein